MSREDFIKKLRESAERLSKVMGCNHFETDKGTCGIWDEISNNVTMTEMLESQYGDCSTEWKFTNDDNTVKVQTRFRFSSPCISIRQTINEPYGDKVKSHTNFIELEFNDSVIVRDSVDDEDYESERVGEFKCIQISLWHDWMSLRDQLMNSLDEDIKKIVEL